MTSLLTKSCITKLFQTEITSSPTLVTLSDLSRCMIASSKNWNFTSVLSCKKMFFSLLEYILLKINEEKRKRKPQFYRVGYKQDLDPDPQHHDASSTLTFSMNAPINQLCVWRSTRIEMNAWLNEWMNEWITCRSMLSCWIRESRTDWESGQVD